MNPKYGTHWDMLRLICDKVPVGGRIVEFGAGDSSTPLLHERYEHLFLVTIENRLEWLLRWAHLTSRWHQFLFVLNPMDALWAADYSDVTFVDCDPGEYRAQIVKALMDSCGVIVAHNTQPDCSPTYQWGDCFTLFKHRAYDTRVSPWTTAVSNHVDLSTYGLACLDARA